MLRKAANQTNREVLAFQNKTHQVQFPQFSIVVFSKYFNEISKRIILKATYTRENVYCDKDC